MVEDCQLLQILLPCPLHSHVALNLEDTGEHSASELLESTSRQASSDERLELNGCLLIPHGLMLAHDLGDVVVLIVYLQWKLGLSI